MSRFAISSTYALDSDASSELFLQPVQARLDLLLTHVRKKTKGIMISEHAPLSPEEIQTLFTLLPVVLFEPQSPSFFPQAISVVSLYPAQFLHGVGTFVRDTLSRWLVPGQQLPIVGMTGLNFYFHPCPNLPFLFTQHLVGLDNEAVKMQVLHNIPAVSKELETAVMAVYQANRIIAMRGYTKAYQALLIEENWNQLFRRDDRNFFEQVQDLLEKRDSEERLKEVKKNLNRLLWARPKAIDRSIFHEIGPIVSLFEEKCPHVKNVKQMSRVVAHYYLLKKFIASQIERAPKEKHVSVKLYRISLEETNRTIALLIAMNFVSENEKFGQRNLLDAIAACLPQTFCSMRLFLSDRREGKMGLIYAEFAKSDGGKFSVAEIVRLKKSLASEILRNTKRVVHPIFMPRNEEELLRNLVLLSKEIRYVKDLPQVSIHYEKQTDSQLSFIVLLVRMKTPGTPCLHQVFSQGSLKVEIDDIRLLGQTKRKYPKESAILHVSIEKGLFFRPDFSLDLLRARQKVASELQAALGEFRDFNGGMIIKQEEVLSELRLKLAPLEEEHEFLLENYFYSLRPVIAQTIHDPIVLKRHFELLLKNLDIEFSLSPRYLFHETHGKYELFFLLSKSLLPQLDIRKELGEMKKEPHAWTSCSIQFDHMNASGWILRNDKVDSAAKIKQLEQSLTDSACCWG